MRLLWAFLALGLLAACSRDPAWTRPGATEQAFHEDSYVCAQENRVYREGYKPSVVAGNQSGPGGFAQGLSSSFRLPGGHKTDRWGYEACMRARGWRQ